MPRRLGIIAFMVVIVWALVLASQFTGRAPDPEPDSHPVVTLTEFSQIRQGMSYEDCVRIIGAPGNPFGSSDGLADHHENPEWVSYVWRNSPESFVQISFHRSQAERLVAHNLP